MSVQMPGMLAVLLVPDQDVDLQIHWAITLAKTRKLDLLVLHRVESVENRSNEVAFDEPAQGKTAVVIKKVKGIAEGYPFGFLVERLVSGHAVVFMPGAPKPWEGDVMIVEEERVPLISDSSAEAVTCLRRLGNGAGLLLEGKLG